MLKRIILIFGILIFAMSVNAVAKQEYFEMTADRTGNSAEVKIKSLQAFKGFQFKVVCDGKGIEAESAEKGKAFDNTVVSTLEEKGGVVYVLAAYSSPCEPGDVCTVRFKINDMPETAKITMQDIKVATETESLNIPDITAVIDGEPGEPENGGNSGSGSGGNSGSTSKPDKGKESGTNPAVTQKPDDSSAETKKDEPETAVFSDIEGHWGKADILFLSSKGVIKGISETLFSPDTNVTRAEFCALISRTLGLEAVSENIYSDVKVGEWYEKPVLECTAAKLVTGDGGLFRPDDIISRQEMAVIISRVCGFLKMDEKTEDVCGKFTDGAQIEDWARSAVSNVVGHSVMRGYDESHFAPLESTTRAQAATVIRKIYDFKNLAE